MKKKPKVRKEKIAAFLTIYRAAEMTPQGRRKIRDWLRQCQVTLAEHGDNFAKRFTASYRYEGKP